MPKIVIEEKDLTSPGVIDESTDVVYIPGFVNIDPDINSALYRKDKAGQPIKDEYIGIEPNKPTLISSISQFESLCGTEPAYFDEAQLYSDVGGVSATGSEEGFAQDAVPYDGIMFKEHSADPAYVMAKEILSAGLPVLYERINLDNYTKTYKKGDAEPENWKTSYSDYEELIDIYRNVNTGSAQLFFTKQNGKVKKDKITYYTQSTVEDPDDKNNTTCFIPVNDDDIEVVKVQTGDEVISSETTDYYAENSELVTEDTALPEYYYKTPVTFTVEVTPEYKAATYYKVEYNYISLTGTQPADWGTATDKYFQQDGDNYTEVTSDTPYEANKFFEKELKYIKLDAEEAPEDWGTGEYYKKQGTSYIKIEFTTNTTPAFQKDKYIEYNSAEQAYQFIPEKPNDWDRGTGTYFEIGDLVEVGQTEKIIDEKTNTKIEVKYIPHKWMVGFKTGIVKDHSYKNITDTTAPAWDPEKFIYRSNGINIRTMYNKLQSIYDISDSRLSDKGNYSIKYLTSGGYPTYEYSGNTIVTKMINLAETRGDCVAFIDHTDNPYRNQNIDQSDSLYYAVKNDLVTFQNDGEFATMFTPWAQYNRVTTDNDKNYSKSIDYKPQVRMPGSYAYFLSLADSIKVNPNWLAIAGVARGLVQNLSSGGMTTNIPNGAADAMEPRDGIAINPITNIKPYGYTIWGNRTLKNNGAAGNLTATSFLNIRNLVSDIKKEVYRTSRKLTFEQNNDVLWVNFKSEIAPLLDRMLHGYGISSYKLQLDTKHPRYGEKATLCVKIIISPIEPVEDFYVSIVMQDDDTDITVVES